jgi:tetratricopeptide (TPR) repeat protein
MGASRRALIIIAVLIASLGGARETPAQTPPQTQPPSGPAAPPPEDAKQLFDRGTTLYALGHYAEAAPLFERAFELKADPVLLYDAAQAYRFAGSNQRALTLYQSYLHLFGDSEHQAEIEAHIAQLKAAIAQEQAQAAASQASSPANALVASPPPPPKPLMKRPWFWVAVGGGAVAVAGAIVGIVIGTRSHTSPPGTFGTVNAN